MNTAGFSKVVFDQPYRFGNWALKRVPYVETWGQFTAIGLERDGEPIAATIYHDYTYSNILMSFAAIPGKRWLTREYLRAIFRYPFVQLGCRRVTGVIASRNSDSLRFAHKLGARVDGVLKHALPDDDLVVMGILKEDCRWI